MADTWRCSLHRSNRVENRPGISLLVRIVPALADPWRRSVPQQLLSLAPQLKREANKRRRNRPGCLDAGDDIAGDLRDAADPAPLPDGDLKCWQTGGRDPHQHFQVPAICLLLHAETSEFVPPDGAKRRQVGEVCAIDEAQEQPADMRREELLWRQAAGLARTADARAEDEDGLPGDDRRYQIRNEFSRIAAVAIEEDHNVGIIAHSGDARLDGTTVAALRLNNHASSGGLSPLSRTVP